MHGGQSLVAPEGLTAAQGQSLVAPEGLTAAQGQSLVAPEGLTAAQGSMGAAAPDVGAHSAASPVIAGAPVKSTYHLVSWRATRTPSMRRKARTRSRQQDGMTRIFAVTSIRPEQGRAVKNCLIANDKYEV
jgi:hypothetical protein